MYTVVGCRDCGALKLVEGRPETTRCPRCGRRSQFKKLRAFYRSEDVDAAREARARLLAQRGGNEAAYNEVGSFADIDEAADEAGMDDEEYLERAGLDADEVAAAGERAGRGRGSSGSRKDRVLDALRALDRPTEAEVVEHAEENGVPADYVRTALEKLRHRGEVSETGGRYRLL
ncbi:DUF5817 domain-containing protein [Halomarina litorea]|uniref:DUF5817 domain-containing protein n=1 Tax=Halomarina litorea TaxID=2961595 RepID=UPI0020C2AE02|nr:DUF5817 domain-containing protein [Halomarina sp. BCD28]